MPIFREYLSLERRAARGAVSGAKALVYFLRSASKAAVSVLSNRYTVVLMPHDHKPPLRFSFNAAICLLTLSFVLSSFFLVPLFRVKSLADSQRLAETSSQISEVRKSADALREEISGLTSTSKDFNANLDKVESSINRNGRGQVQEAQGGILSFFSFGFLHKEETVELNWMLSERRKLEASSDKLVSAGSAIKNVRETLIDIPTLWPIRVSSFHVSQPYGLTPNPFTGIPYMHKGIDISDYRSGDPIIATASGTVLAAAYDPVSGYGNNVIIGHRYGYTTRYGHMLSYRVRPGQNVKQGDVIGYIGNTGLSTGPHVHYEVHLGPDLLDPMSMIITNLHG